MDEIRFKVDGINITCNNNQCTVLKIDLALLIDLAPRCKFKSPA
jgi:hypothetical protein